MDNSLLFYNLYPKYLWKEITASLLQTVPHDDIVVHVTLPVLGWFRKKAISNELRKYAKVKQIIFSRNKKNEGESIGLEKLKVEVDLNSYSTLTYIHSKGSSKSRKNSQPIKDWTELMRYFVVERLDLAQVAFASGYYTYGVLLSTNMHPREKDKIAHPDTKFIYEGNFITVDLSPLREKILNTSCKKDYYGAERFWGRLCAINKAYCAHQTGVDHYNQNYPSENYIEKSKN